MTFANIQSCKPLKVFPFDNVHSSCLNDRTENQVAICSSIGDLDRNVRRQYQNLGQAGVPEQFLKFQKIFSSSQIKYNFFCEAYP